MKFTSIQESNDYKESLKAGSVGKEILSILIATTIDRRMMFNMLMQEFHWQIEEGGFKGPGMEKWEVHVVNIDSEGNKVLKDGEQMITVFKQQFKHPDLVELIFIEDNKEISIGKKRQQLLEKAKGKYIVFFDSDDMPRKGYVKKIMDAIQPCPNLIDGPDCVGFKIHMTTNGENPETCIHSLGNPEWKHDGVNYLRNVTHFNPVRRELALSVGFPDIRFGEDKAYSDRVSLLCKSEKFIDEYLFDYRYSNKEPHDKKYGYSK